MCYYYKSIYVTIYVSIITIIAYLFLGMKLSKGNSWNLEEFLGKKIVTKTKLSDKSEEKK